MKNTAVVAALLACVASAPLAAKEGMFTPGQLPEIAEDLRAMGLEVAPEKLADLTGFPMGAIVQLQGCSASFVSPEGLVVTNHHCARGSVQYNSTAENNYLEDGFLAQAKADELPAAPGSRVYVTTEITDVTARVRDGIDTLSPTERYETVDQRVKDITAECEQDVGFRCLVASFYGGKEYTLIKRLEVKDVRLVYAPADAVGKYGGDIDNWMWPRHTGDFAFYRAYVAPDGSSAEYAEENVPYRPEHHLKVSAAGLDDGDFVMAAGYPGSTQRYTRLGEVENTFGWTYPTFVTLLNDWIDAIEEAAPLGSDARVKYESRLAGLNNYEKNLRGQIDGARRVGLVDRRREREAALNAWIAADAARAPYGKAIAALDTLSEESATAARTNFWYGNVTRPQLLSAAQRLYRLAKEREKPDAQRESGYQERDMAFFRQGLQALDRRYDAAVDKAEWLLFLGGYLEQPAAERVAVLDEALGIAGASDIAQVEEFHYSGLGVLAYGVPRQRVHQNDLLGHLVGCEALPREAAQRVHVERVRSLANDCRANTIAPIRVRDTDHGAVHDSGVGSQHVLDFQRGYLLAAGLEDVHARATEDAVRAVLDHRLVTCIEPVLFSERILRLLLTPPVG